MFEILYGTRWKVFPSVVISQYLLGVSISKCIITGKTLSNVFKEVPVLNTFELWLGVFFVSGALFSFKSIEKTKLLQAVIISVRMASVLLMIGGAIYIACISGVKNFTPKDHGVVNIDAFS